MSFHKTLHTGQKLAKKNHRILAKLWKVRLKLLYSCDISLNADIAESVWFCHSGFGVVVNPNAVIKDNVYVQHGVTIGEMDDSHKSPVIEENVYIGAKAMILGDIKIGKNAKIGAGAVVITDVPENSTAVGVPAKILYKEVVAK